MRWGSFCVFGKHRLALSPLWCQLWRLRVQCPRPPLPRRGNSLLKKLRGGRPWVPQVTRAPCAAAGLHQGHRRLQPAELWCGRGPACAPRASQGWCTGWMAHTYLSSSLRWAQSTPHTGILTPRTSDGDWIRSRVLGGNQAKGGCCGGPDPLCVLMRRGQDTDAGRGQPGGPRWRTRGRVRLQPQRRQQEEPACPRRDLRLPPPEPDSRHLSFKPPRLGTESQQPSTDAEQRANELGVRRPRVSVHSGVGGMQGPGAISGCVRRISLQSHVCESHGVRWEVSCSLWFSSPARGAQRERPQRGWGARAW